MAGTLALVALAVAAAAVLCLAPRSSLPESIVGCAALSLLLALAPTLALVRHFGTARVVGGAIVLCVAGVVALWALDRLSPEPIKPRVGDGEAQG